MGEMSGAVALVRSRVLEFSDRVATACDCLADRYGVSTAWRRAVDQPNAKRPFSFTRYQGRPKVFHFAHIKPRLRKPNTL